MSLNIDIYLMLMDHLESPSDISALMRSCKTLCALGAKRLLLPGVTIRSDAVLVSFSRFMLRDLAARIPHLRRLFLCIELQIIDDDGSGSVYECDPEIIEQEMLKGGRLLSRVLRRATALEHLTIHFCEELLEREESLVDALIALRNVRYLHISSYGLRAHEVVAEINSPLVHVNVDCSASNTHHDVDIAQTLARHRNTLEKVTAWDINLMANDMMFVPPQADDSDSDEIVFPHVHSLCIRSSLALDLGYLAHSFPNLRSLDVADVRLTGRYTLDHASHLRDTNVATAEGWRSLDHLCGDDLSLNILGLKHSVKRLDVELDNLGWLDDPVTDARPTHFLLHGGFATENIELLWDLEDALPVVAANSSITHFGLDMYSNELGPDADDIMTQILQFIVAAASSLTFFALRLRALPLEEESAYARDDHRYPTAPTLPRAARHMLRDLAGVEPPSWVRKMAEAAPALRYVSVDLEGHAPSCWQVCAPEKDSGRIVLAPLDPEEGKAIVRAEGMEWRLREPAAPRFDEEKLVVRGVPFEEDEWAWDEDCEVSEDSVSEDESEREDDLD
ncbi:hypothetical protein TRAPUB_10473 [Trametes pubescens]|uniref:F-box domain-containing protein n=1 Tax=Trametes pubescens TaxID=154538 RepID=A0A1M2VZP1_TRAPU|nr:hypothetical protein TRAPUB_10473 [Trametes pubescens]